MRERIVVLDIEPEVGLLLAVGILAHNGHADAEREQLAVIVPRTQLGELCAVRIPLHVAGRRTEINMLVIRIKRRLAAHLEKPPVALLAPLSAALQRQMCQDVVYRIRVDLNRIGIPSLIHNDFQPPRGMG